MRQAHGLRVGEVAVAPSTQHSKVISSALRCSSLAPPTLPPPTPPHTTCTHTTHTTAGLDAKLQALAQLFELASTTTQADQPLCLDCAAQLKDEIEAQVRAATLRCAAPACPCAAGPDVLRL